MTPILCMPECTHTCAYQLAYTEVTENLRQLGLSFHFVGPRNRTQVIRLAVTAPEPAELHHRFLVQVVTGALKSWVQWPSRAWETAFHSTAPPHPLTLTFFLPPLWQCTLGFEGSDVDVPWRAEHSAITSSHHFDQQRVFAKPAQREASLIKVDSSTHLWV